MSDAAIEPTAAEIVFDWLKVNADARGRVAGYTHRAIARATGLSHWRTTSALNRLKVKGLIAAVVPHRGMAPAVWKIRKDGDAKALRQTFPAPPALESVFRWMADNAGEDGLIEGVTIAQIAQAIDVPAYAADSAIRSLCARKAIRMAKRGNGHRSAVWEILTDTPDLGNLHLHRQAYRDVTPEANRRVSQRLLARLLKFHGDNPPDRLAAKAAANLKTEIAAGRAA